MTKQEQLNELKRDLVRSVCRSTFFNKKTCEYNPTRQKMPARVKKLIKEIETLEKELKGKPQGKDPGVKE